MPTKPLNQKEVLIKTMQIKSVNTVIIGASAAGLACAAQLKRKNIDYVLLEREDHVAKAWRNHYDRLHLHTNKAASSLPFLKFPNQVGKYPSRLDVIAYLEQYCKELDLSPQFNTEVLKIKQEDSHWITETDQSMIKSKHVIICTGNTKIPKPYLKPGIESFSGKIMHSSNYKNGKSFEGQRVLVVGFGNSACEIAICLHEHGAIPAMSVRSAVNIIPRDVLGIPSLTIGVLQSKISPRLADKLNKPIIKLAIGNVRKLGLKQPDYGPIEQIVKHHKIPLLDIGTVKLIRDGEVKIYGDLVNISKNRIQFENNQSSDFDAIIVATGYSTGLEKIIDISENRLNDIRYSVKKRQHFGQANLFFCGYHVAPTGMLREIKIESKLIAEQIT